jgi:hypothetical protein
MAQTDYWTDVEWLRMLRLELLGDGVTAGESGDRYSRRDWKALVMDRCNRWYKRVHIAHTARQLRAQTLIPALLQQAGLGLLARLEKNRDVLDAVLQQAFAALCSEHGLDPRTRLALAHL